MQKLIALGIYALIWFVGDYRAFTARPILLTRTDLHVRVGLRWETSIAIDNILEIRTHMSQEEKPGDALSQGSWGNRICA